MAFSGAFVKPFRPAFDAGLAPGNGLLNNLVAYWKLDEANGNALDAHTGGLTLDDTNTVTSAAGKVYATARQYTAANSEYHTRPGDDALLSVGDLDFSFSAWVYFDTVGTTSKWIVAKRTVDASSNGYQLEFFGSDLGGTNRMAFAVLSAGAATIVTANTFGALSTGTWYHIVCWHDATANQIGIDVNGAIDTTAHSIGVGDDTGKFSIGRLPASSAPYFFHNGRIGPVAFWKSAAGSGGCLSAVQRAALYNGGAGLGYVAFTT